MNVPHPAPVSAISSTGVAVAWGVTDGVPGPGVVVGTSVMVGGGVFVAGPGTGVFVRVGLGGLVTEGGFLVGGMGEMVTVGVTGRSVGDGTAVDVWVGVSVGSGVKVVVGGVGGVAVLVGVGVWVTLSQFEKGLSLCRPLYRVHRVHAYIRIWWVRRCVERDHKGPFIGDGCLAQFQTAATNPVPVEGDRPTWCPERSGRNHRGHIPSHPLDGVQLDVRRSRRRGTRRGLALIQECSRRLGHNHNQQRDHPDQTRDSNRESGSLWFPPISGPGRYLTLARPTTTPTLASKNHRLLWSYIGYKPIVSLFTVVVNSTPEPNVYL